MEKIILDASVVIKWFTQEVGSEKALKYLYLIKESKRYLILPQLFFYEIGNILISKQASMKDAIYVITQLNNLPIEQEPTGHSSFRKVFQNAQELKITFYDASYITLMQQEDCEFVTADKNLYEKVRKKLSNIKLL